MTAKILLVEDDEMNRDMLSRRLELHGYDVVQATDGAEGLALAGTAAPDLILMDMNLPELDGWETVRRLKAEEATRGVPVIALTADALMGDREKALHAGCDDYEAKPINWPGLVAKMAALLGEETTR